MSNIFVCEDIYYFQDFITKNFNLISHFCEIVILNFKKPKTLLGTINSNLLRDIILISLQK
jgi:hypothetical protein